MKICVNLYPLVSVSTAALRRSVVHIFNLLFSCRHARCHVLSWNAAQARISDNRACLFRTDVAQMQPLRPRNIYINFDCHCC